MDSSRGRARDWPHVKAKPGHQLHAITAGTSVGLFTLESHAVSIKSYSLRPVKSVHLDILGQIIKWSKKYIGKMQATTLSSLIT